MPTANSISWKLRRFFPPKKQSTTTSTEPGNNRPDLLRIAADAVVVVTVNVETMLPAVFTVAGAKLHAVPVGRPEQVNATVEVEEKPFSGVTVTVSVELAPAVTVMVAGETANAKSGVELLAADVALAWFEAVEVPTESIASTT
jgi:hypothetical protein